MNNFNWKDPFLLSEQLNEEEKLVQQSAAQFALKELSSREDNIEILIATLPEPVKKTG